MSVERNHTQGHDVPRHEAGETSSIGGLWPPEHSSFDRVKAFYDRCIRTEEDLAPFYESFMMHRQRMLVTESFSRVQFRAIVTRAMLETIATDPARRGTVEAVIALDPSEFDEAPYMVYFGANAPQRMTHEDDLLTTERNIASLVGIVRREPSAILQKARDNGYEIDILHLPDSFGGMRDVLEQMSQLYARFGWSRADVADLLRNPNNIIAVAKKGQDIISAGIAELAAIPVEGRLLRIAEITEAATRDGHEGNGAYAAVSTRLLTELAGRSLAGDILGGQIDVVFGECNAYSFGVLKVALLQGRTLSYQTCQEIGFVDAGIVLQQVPIDGAPRSSAFNDLIPASLRRSELISLYGGQI